MSSRMEPDANCNCGGGRMSPALAPSGPTAPAASRWRWRLRWPFQWRRFADRYLAVLGIVCKISISRSSAGLGGVHAPEASAASAASAMAAAPRQA